MYIPLKEHALFGKEIKESKKTSIHAGLRLDGSRYAKEQTLKNDRNLQLHIEFLGRM